MRSLGPLAQPAEQGPLKPKVVGSIPTRPIFRIARKTSAFSPEPIDIWIGRMARRATIVVGSLRGGAITERGSAVEARRGGCVGVRHASRRHAALQLPDRRAVEAAVSRLRCGRLRAKPGTCTGCRVSKPASLPRICLIYTGGTIGMVRDRSGELRPPEDPADFLRVAPELGELVSYTFVPLLNKDSTNVVPSDWVKIASEIYRRCEEGYDGFVVVHGTDTMHFSAAAVAFALGPALPVPVVFTGAQTIPEVLHGDARVNLLRACKVASADLAEVVIVFGDFIFRGARAQKKHEARFDAFESPAQCPLGLITEEILISSEAMKRTSKPGTDDFELRAEFAKGVLQVSLIPGLEPSLVMPALEHPACNGLILQAFGAGNVPDAGIYSFRELIEMATSHGKPVVVTSQFPANATLHSAYRPGRDAMRAGAISTGNMTASCSVAKFRWALAQVERDGAEPAARIGRVREIMNRNYIGEMDVPPGMLFTE